MVWLYMCTQMKQNRNDAECFHRICYQITEVEKKEKYKIKVYQKNLKFFSSSIVWGIQS